MKTCGDPGAKIDGKSRTAAAAPLVELERRRGDAQAVRGVQTERAVDETAATAVDHDHVGACVLDRDIACPCADTKKGIELVLGSWVGERRPLRHS